MPEPGAGEGVAVLSKEPPPPPSLKPPAREEARVVASREPFDYAEARKALDLPKEKTLEQIAHENEEARKKAVEEAAKNIRINTRDAEIFRTMLTPEIIASFPQEEQVVFRMIKSGDFPSELIPFAVHHRNLFDQKTGFPKLEFFEEATKSDMTDNSLSALGDLLIPEIINTFPKEEQSFWHEVTRGREVSWISRFLINAHKGYDNQRFLFALKNRHLFDRQTGLPTLAFFEEAAKANDKVSGILTPQITASFPEAEKTVLQTVISYEENSNLFNFAILHRDLFDRQTGLPKVEFFEAALKDPSLASGDFLKTTLTEESMASFPPEKKPYWQIVYKSVSNPVIFSLDWQIAYRSVGDPDKLRFIFSLEKDEFSNKYQKEDGSFDEQLLDKDFVYTEILRPERITRWEILQEIFDRLGDESSGGLRANSYLRIAEALNAGTLTQRTGVEALGGLQRSFSSLFRSEMSPLERKTYFILRNNLPFATNEALRGEMRQKALDVEAVDRANLSWVHEAIHNYVRVQNPEYIDVLRKYIVDGGEENERKLKSLAQLYSPDSRPPESFFTEETRTRLKDSEQARRVIAELVSLTSRYFTLNLADVNRSMAAVGEEVLGAETYQYLNGVPELLSKEGDEASSNLLTFLERMPDIRKDLLAKATAEENPERKTNLLSLDTVLAAVYKRVFPGYINLYLEPKMPKEGKTAEITPQDARSVVALLRSLVKTGRLEGDFQGYDQDFVNEWINVEEAGQMSRASFHAFFLLLNTREKHGQLASRKEFESLAQDEMVAMLKRMGMSEEEAIGRVRMTDIVNFYKQSYEFIGEPLENLAVTNFSLFEEQIGRPEEVKYEIIMGGIKTGNSVIDSYLEEMQKSLVMPKDESGAKSFYDKLLEMSDFKAEKMCRFLIPDYIDQKTGIPQYVKREIDGKTVEIYPFTFYGADGVVMLIDGQRVENPLEKIKEIYKQNIVPAMYHALREGD